MTSAVPTSSRVLWWHGLLAFALAASLSWCTMRHGLELGPDALQYWSASISLLKGRGYVDGHGLLVQGWPPGYSIWLAGWQACFGVSVGTLALAESFAIGCMAASVTVWGCLRLPQRLQSWPIVVAAVAASLAAARGVGSERLMLSLLFAALACIEWLRSARGMRYVGLLAVLTGCCVGMALVRHAALAFLPGMWFLLGGLDSRRRLRATGSLAVVVVGAVLAWWGSHIALGQDAQGWFAGTHDLNSLVFAMIDGINRGLAPWPIGIVVFVAAYLVFGPLRQRCAARLGLSPASMQHGDVGAFVWCSLAVLLLVFLLVYVADLPKARFVRFASILTAVLLAGVASQCQKPRLRWLLMVLFLLPNVVYAGKHVVVGRRSVTNINESGGSMFLPHHAVLGAPGSSEQLLANGQLRIAEPLFRWQRERLERGERR